jgi:hypothetical protein
MGIALGGIAAAVALVLAWPEAAPSAPSELSAPAQAGTGQRSRRAGQATGARAAAPAFRPHAAPERRGATVHGTVRWGDGVPVAKAEVALLDAEGEVVGEVLTDDSGAYALEDQALVGAELHIVEPFGEGHRRDLAPLVSGEDRSVDVVLGEMREIVGWVLDSLGDPQPFVSVTLSWERAQVGWRAVTDAEGGFTFVAVPATPVRVTADGGDLGIASARLAQSDATRREVTLVLEPVGTIVVVPSPEVAAVGQAPEVIVRCFSASAHGEDGLWNDDLRTMDVYDGLEAIPEDMPYDAEATPYEPERPPEGLEEPPAAEPSMVELETALGNALRAWDETDPEGSLVRMALDLASANSRMADELRGEVEREHPELAGASLEELARAAAAKAIREEPRLVDMMGVAALKIREGASPMDAVMAAGQEMVEAQAAEEPVVIEDPPSDLEPPPDFEPALVEEGSDAADYQPAAETGVEIEALDMEAMELDNLEPDPFLGRLEELRDKTGVELIEGYGEARSQVTTGRFFDPIPVRGAFEYQVSVRHPDGFELICGSVFVAAGEEVEIACGKAGPAILAGRVVDVAGRAVEGAVVDVYAGETVTTTTDAEGRYELTVPVTSAQLLSVSAHDSSFSVWTALRRNQNARPGMRSEVPDLVARLPEEAPVPWLNEPYGGVGAGIELGNEGIVVTRMFDDGPLALAGVEEGDVIIRIGEEIGASLSTDDALLLLRGEAGTEVDLTLRSSAGELYELLVTRGLVDPTRQSHVD